MSWHVCCCATLEESLGCPCPCPLCRFCKETYQFGEEEIMGMVREMKGPATPAAEESP